MLAGTRQLRLQGTVSVHAHRTEGVTGSENREGANEVGRGIRVGSEIGVGGGIGVGGEIGVGGGNRDVNGDGDGDGAGTRTGVEVNGGTQDGNVEGSGDGGGDPWMNIGWKWGRERRRKRKQEREWERERERGRVREGGEEVKKHKKTYKRCRRDVGNREDLGGKINIYIQERVGSVPADPHKLKNGNEAGLK